MSHSIALTPFPQELNDDGGSTMQLDTIAEEQLTPIEEQLSDLKNELGVIENQINGNKLEIKRMKGNQRDITNGSDDDLRQINKALIARKKSMGPVIASLEKQ